MPDAFDKRRAPKTPERSQTPLWYAIVGMVIALFSRGMHDEMMGEVVLWFGLVFAGVALIYWAFRPKHGMP